MDGKIHFEHMTLNVTWFLISTMNGSESKER
jgi:hypothetical protein